MWNPHVPRVTFPHHVAPHVTPPPRVPGQCTGHRGPAPVATRRRRRTWPGGRCGGASTTMRRPCDDVRCQHPLWGKTNGSLLPKKMGRIVWKKIWDIIVLITNNIYDSWGCEIMKKLCSIMRNDEKWSNKSAHLLHLAIYAKEEVSDNVRGKKIRSWYSVLLFGFASRCWYHTHLMPNTVYCAKD